jgi:hypothetical protein
MIHLSVPVLAHSTAVCPTSPHHYTHTSILCLSAQAVTTSEAHNYSPQDKKILYSIYSDILTITQRALTIFATDPSRALAELSELNRQLSSAIQ